MSSTRARLLALALPAALMSAAGLACNREDCKCADPSYSLSAIPRADATDVPTNTRIWGDEPNTRLLDDAGVEVPATRTTVTDPLGQGMFTVLRPLTELRPHSVYTVDTAPGTHTFFTGAGPLSEPPPIPEIDELEQDHYRDCGQLQYSASYTLHGAGVVYLLDTASTTTFDPVNLVGEVSGFSSSPSFYLGPKCGGADNFPGGASRHASTTVRFAALDVAGNFSGWSEPEELTLTGCQLGSDPSLALLVMMPLLLGSRRRRSLPASTDPRRRIDIQSRRS